MSQVSALPSPSYLSHASGASNTTSPGSATDPAELLRQAALSSRKLKRRKLDVDPSLAPFPRPISRSFASTTSISLDYGQEEEPSPTTLTSTPQQPHATPAPAPAWAPTPTRAVVPSSPPRAVVQRGGFSGATAQTPLGDDTTREEGEISESEDDPPFRPPSKSIPAPITVPGAPYANIRLEAIGSVQARSPYHVASRSPSIKVEEDGYRHASLPTSVTTSVMRSSLEAEPAVLRNGTSLADSFRLETALYVLDPDHVRPGLSLTQAKYDTAKKLILDILGYGVPPEYLIDCGLSREFIYYVFTELNLRLPSGFDTVGIPPYPPHPDVMAHILLSQSGHPLTSSSSAMPGATAYDDTTRPGSVAHNPSPRPPAPHSSTSTPVPQVATTVAADGSLSASVLALSESTLTVIERQRKQELLARKAVQASRKRKESVPLSTTQTSALSTATTPTMADASAKSSAPAVSVDDFLNSIGPPLSDTTDSKSEPDVVESPGQSTPEPMSVDEIIPGFGRNASEYDQPLRSASVLLPSGDTPLPRSASISERSFSVEPEKEPPILKASQPLENLPTRSRSDGILVPHSARDSEPDSSRSSSTPQPTAPIPRRGTKRPVAADFDSEPMPKAYYTPPVLSRTGSGSGFSNGAAYHPNPHVRRKMNGFASLNSARRCVIDVSDSEDDTSEDETPTASTPHSGGTQSSARDSALALELEIERMRKIIREREEMKLRKQVMASSRSTPVSSWESPAVPRSFEGESSEVAASSSSTTRNEIPRSEAGNVNASDSENVLAITYVPVPVSCPSPISSTPSPPGSPPLSQFQEGGSDARVAIHAALTDQSATPADGDQPIGGPVLAAETRQESAASSRASTPPQSMGTSSHRSLETGPEQESVDTAASAQVPNGLQVTVDSSFTAYDSVLSHYPFLSGRSLGPQEMADMPNLKGLMMQTAARRMANYGLENARICQYEVPGGGECRDKSCEDLHWNLLEVEPNDDETAQYLCGDQNVAQMVQALQAARTRRPEASFDERVNEVWASMRGRRTQVSFDDKT